MCSQDDLQKILSATYQHAKKTFGDKLDSVILYGSYARGDFDDESDIDVMILVDLPAEELRRYENDLCFFASRLGLEKDILLSLFLKDKGTFYRYLDSLPFYRNVMREGVKISA